ncbi:MAG: hypothetical protein ACI9EF_003157 [Pseudohongiellaceae bacterium]
MIVPGLGRLAEQGAPDLPTARIRVAVPTDTPTLDVVSVYDLDPRTMPGLRAYPYEVEELDGGPDGSPLGTPAQFVIDENIYGGAQAFPSTSALPTEIVSLSMESDRGDEPQSNQWIRRGFGNEVLAPSSCARRAALYP